MLQDRYDPPPLHGPQDRAGQGLSCREWERKEALVAMQSSTTVACRVGVMLVCLIAIPLAALFGTKLPGLVWQWLERGQNGACVSAEAPRSAAPPFGPPAPAPPPNGRGIPSGWGASSTESALATGQARKSPKAPESPRQSADPAPTHYLDNRRRMGCPQLAPVSVGHTPGSTVAISPAVFESNKAPLVCVAPAEWRQDSARTEGVLSHVGPGPGDHSAPAHPFVETPQAKNIQRQLRESGASYYALETWGARGELYRFHARMAAGHGASYVRHFDAIDRDAVQAMGSVLDQVKQWRASQGHLESEFPP